MEAAAFGHALCWLQECGANFSAEFAQELLPTSVCPAAPDLPDGANDRMAAEMVRPDGGGELFFSIILADLPYPDWIIAGVYFGTLAIPVFGGLEAKTAAGPSGCFSRALSYCWGLPLWCCGFLFSFAGFTRWQARAAAPYLARLGTAAGVC